MKDKLKPVVPVTGNKTKLKLYLGLAGTSIIAVGVIILLKKKKEKKENRDE